MEVLRCSVIATLISLSALSLRAQEFKALEDTLEIESFMAYVGNILTHHRDSTVYTSETIRYRCIYQTTCPFTEVITGLGDGQIGAVGYTSGQSFLLHEENEYGWPYDRAHEREGTYLCAESPRMCTDSMEVRITSEGFFDASIISAYPFQDRISLAHGQWEGTESYGDHSFLIVERSQIFNIGSQTSRGTTETYYLERID